VRHGPRASDRRRGRCSGKRPTVGTLFAVLCPFLLADCAPVADAGAHTFHHDAGPTGCRSRTRGDVPRDTRAALGQLTVSEIHIEEPPPGDTTLRSATLRFAVSNVSSHSFRDPVIRIALFERSGAERTGQENLLVGGPFVMRGSFVLEPGHTTYYEIGLRKLPPDCRCQAEIDVLSAGWGDRDDDCSPR
jgi:hypothetical protein